MHPENDPTWRRVFKRMDPTALSQFKAQFRNLESSRVTSNKSNVDTIDEKKDLIWVKSFSASFK